MALTRVDSYLIDLDAIGGITFDDQAGIPTLKVDAVTHRVGIGTIAPATALDVNGDVTITDKIIHASDTNTAIRFPVNDTVSVETAGSERLRVDSAGQIRVIGSGTAASPAIVVGNDLNTGIYSPGADQLALSTAGNGRLFIDGTGFVGIGTVPTVGYGLDVRGLARLLTVGGASGLEIGNGTATNQSAYLDLVGDATYTDYGLRVLRGNTGANANSTIRHKGTGALSLVAEEAGSITLATNNTERLCITSAGLVGIGASAPTTNLDVLSSTTTQISATTTDATGASIAGLLLNQQGAGASSFIARAGSNYTVLGATTNTAVLFLTNNLTRMAITAAGNVGIGTTSPSALLHIKGTNNGTAGQVEGSATADYTYLQVFNPSGIQAQLAANGNVEAQLRVVSNHPLSFYTNNTERARIDSAGNVGIGDSSPSTRGRLSVISTTGVGRQFVVTTAGQSQMRYDDNSAPTNLELQNYAMTAANHGAVIGWSLGDSLANANTAGSITVAAEGIWGATSASRDSFMAFSTTLDGTSNARVRITSAGNVGIGITNPSQKLQVSGHTSIIGGGFLLMQNANRVQWGSSDTAYIAGQDGGSGYLALATAGTERARLDSGGRLLVGTSTALTATDVAKSKLVLQGDTDGPGYPARFSLNNSVATMLANYKLGEIYFAGQAAGNIGASIAAYAESDWNTAGDPTDNPGYLTFSTTADGASSSTERMRITNNGSVLIGHVLNVGSTGTIAPLGYVGRSGTSGSFVNVFNIAWTGSVANLWIDTTNLGAIQVSSDYRIKKNIQTQTAPAIERIKLLRPITYELKDYESLVQSDGVQREGFIAHEVQEVIPSGAEGEKDEENRIQNLRLDAIVSVLTKAMQEAVERIESLEAEVAALKAL